MRSPVPAGRERGFALLIVLWALVPITLLFMTLAVTARSDLRSANDLRAAAVLEAAADGAIATAVFDVLRTGQAEGAARRLRVPGADVVIDLAGLSGLVNPNAASPELLRALLVRLGASDARGRAIAAAMVDWRTPGQKAGVNGAKAAEYRGAGLDYGPPGAPFESLDELGLVLGMTPQLLVALTPVMSLYADGDPDPRTAPPAVRLALSDIGTVRGRGAPNSEVLQITAAASGAGGARSVRQAVVRFGYAGSQRGWRVLAWETVADPAP